MSTAFLLTALDIGNYPLAFDILSAEGFCYTLNPESLPLIKTRLFTRSANIPITVKLLLIACLFINRVALEANESKQCVEWLSEEIKTGSFKEVAAGLLLRLPNQNYPLVLPYLHPSTVPLNIMLEKAQLIK